MIQTTWGLLGPEKLNIERRTRTLGLGAAVRGFNDLAVPGLGGVWFGKQLFIALLGIAVAEGARSRGKRVQNIETANAIEALACWLALDGNGWQQDPRLRGRLKMRDKTDLSFAAVRKRTFYVAQPMRPSTLQPLRMLGLVESTGERFNSFTCSTEGADFVEAVTAGLMPYRKTVRKHLIDWVASGEEDNVRSADLREALSPLSVMSRDGRHFLRESLIKGIGEDVKRRRAALNWVNSLTSAQQSITWETRPAMIDQDHWNDLVSGALFFSTRDAAIKLLIAIEIHISNRADQKCLLTDAASVPNVENAIEELRQRARAFLNSGHDPTPGQMAQAFSHECLAAQAEDIVRNIIDRDGRVLMQRGQYIVPGPAFRGRDTERDESARSSEEDGAETTVRHAVAWPEGISHRVRNLYLLNLDLRGELSKWLSEFAATSE